MQVKKEEIRQTIIDVATNEFMRMGYENVSMRVIAYKANTTIGNIYHYFKNKEVLLQTILIPVFDNIENLMKQHFENEIKCPLTQKEALYYAEHLEEFFDKSELRGFLDKRIVIILKLESSSLLERKEKFIEELQEHLQQHIRMKDDAHYSKIVIDVLADCLKHVLIEHDNINDAKAEFIKLFRLFCTGFIGQMK
ncbi:TetR/AcrR family transcriptional regulator [Extibacter muris]|uniref:TetR/AcrR family transcriptional regulator n=1 Tax=Extibacter muris TaxID=1796622 RepID=A0A4V2WSI8_9FIRM|nr:TetR/AcrR family transcriptional regulator [Extibacter muris]MCU0078812.1 TetR/AcrR family transcriptional regulator [Extibacter muris]TDA21800.1 TetR/AcrR family transcriptional regulator [Extibacter muris]